MTARSTELPKSEFMYFDELSRVEKRPPPYPQAPMAAGSYEDTSNDEYMPSEYVESRGQMVPGKESLSLYDRIQLPLLIAVVYFLLQLPIVSHLITEFGFGHWFMNETGQITTEGHVLKSIMMGGLFYAVHTYLASV